MPNLIRQTEISMADADKPAPVGFQHVKTLEHKPVCAVFRDPTKHVCDCGGVWRAFRQVKT